MKIIANAILRGAEILANPGDEIDVPDQLAQALIRAGVATEKAIDAPIVEKAIIEHPEAEVPPEEPVKAKPEWPPSRAIKKSPAEYLEAYPDGKWADRARECLE